MQSDWLIALAISLGTFLVFTPVLHGEFLPWDDDIQIYRNPYFGGLSWDRIVWMFTDLEHSLRYKPLTWLSWVIAYEFFSLDPFGYHLVSLLFHALNSGLVFLLLRQLWSVRSLSQQVSAGTGYRLVCCALGALWWAVHPLRVEPVAWVTGLNYCQSTFFLLVSLLCYLRANQPAAGNGSGGLEKTAPHPVTPEGSSRDHVLSSDATSTASESRSRPVFYWCSVLAFAASLLSYPIAMAFVPILLALEVYPLRRIRWTGRFRLDIGARRVLLQMIPFLAAAVLAFSITLLARVISPGIWSPPPSVAEFGILSRVMQAFYIWAYYLWKPWVPFDLSPVYPALINFDPTGMPFILSLLAVVGISGVLVASRRRWPGLAVLWIAHLVLLIPMLGLTEHPHFPSDRYSYSVGICWGILVTAVLLRIQANPPMRLAVCSVAALLVAGSVSMASRQTRVWQNSLGLFLYSIEQMGDHPYRSDLYRRLGHAWLDRRDYDRAEGAFLQAIRIDPGSAEPHSGLGDALFFEGKLDAAAVSYKEALRLKPAFASAHNNLGLVRFKQGKLAEAAVHYGEAVRINPRDAEAHNNWGDVLAAQKQLGEAIAHYHQAIQLNPGFSDAYNNLAIALAAQGRFGEALTQFARAVAVNPNNAVAHYNLAITLRRLGREAEARHHFGEADRIRGHSLPSKNPP